jgi:hypothetical protein
MADAKIIERIAKLLELADEDRGGTEAERELATHRAHEMMLKYNIEEGEVSGRSAKGDIIDEDFIIQGSTAEWKAKLPILMGHQCFVDGYFQQLGRFKWRVVLVGRPENITFVRKLSDALIPWLEGEASSGFDHAKEESELEGLPEPKPRSFRRAFYDSATAVIVRRLQAEREEQITGNGMELVRNERAANEQFMKDKGVQTKEARSREYSSAVGSALGGRAGVRADLTPPPTPGLQ